jgi:hypothetical protein
MVLPKEGTYFVVAGNGTWLHKDTGVVRCFVPVDDISFLQDLDASVELETKLPKIPERTVWRIKEFFRRVVEVHRAESEVTLYYSKDKGDFKVHIPEQFVSHGGVQYKRAGMTHIEGMEDYLRVGTIHSHCDFNAFHSGTDEHDEEDFDGLHVTFGHNDRDEFTISASVVVNGFRMKIDPATALEGVTNTDKDFYRLTPSVDPGEHGWNEGINEWMDQVFSRYCQTGNIAKSFTTIAKGDRIEWVGEMASSAASLRTVMGDGPFDVLGTDDGKVIIRTKVGMARLSKKLFKKVYVI